MLTKRNINPSYNSNRSYIKLFTISQHDEDDASLCSHTQSYNIKWNLRMCWCNKERMSGVIVTIVIIRPCCNIHLSAFFGISLCITVVVLLPFAQYFQHCILCCIELLVHSDLTVAIRKRNSPIYGTILYIWCI